MRQGIAALTVALICGCTTVSDVTQTGPGKYMVGSLARGGFTSDTEVKAQAVAKAQVFCAAKGAVADVTSSTSTGVQMWTPQNAEVNFTCVAK